MTNFRYDKPWIGEFCMTQGSARFRASVGGNARQRRLIVRRWKKLGWTVNMRSTGALK